MPRYWQLSVSLPMELKTRAEILRGMGLLSLTEVVRNAIEDACNNAEVPARELEETRAVLASLKKQGMSPEELAKAVAAYRKNGHGG